MREWTLRFWARRAAKCLAGSEGWCTIQRCCVLLGWAWLSLRSGGSKGAQSIWFPSLRLGGHLGSSPLPHSRADRLRYGLRHDRQASVFRVTAVACQRFSVQLTTQRRVESLVDGAAVDGHQRCPYLLPNKSVDRKVTRSREMLGEFIDVDKAVHAVLLGDLPLQLRELHIDRRLAHCSTPLQSRLHHEGTWWT